MRHAILGLLAVLGLLSSSTMWAAELALTLTQAEEGAAAAQLWAQQGNGWRAIRRLEQPVFVAAGSLWSLRMEPAQTSYVDCECVQVYQERGRRVDPDRPPKACKKAATVAIPVAVQVGGAKRIRLASAPSDATGEEGVSEPSYQLLGVAGPYVLLADHHYALLCQAAHGAIISTLHVVDMRNGTTVRPWTAAEAKRIAASGSRAAVEAIRRERPSETGADEIGEGQGVELNAVRFRWQNGRFAPQWLLSMFDCYACSDGRWGSYSRSAWISLTQATTPWLQALPPLAGTLASLSKSEPEAIAISLLTPEQAGLLRADVDHAP